MALVIADRVRETTSSSGTGTITLTGAFSGFQPFSTIGNGNTTYYCIIDAATGAWEVGVGTYTTSGNTLSRDTVLSSSNSGSLVNFVAGLKDVICTQPSARAVYLDSASNTTIPGITLSNGTANGVSYLDASKVLTTGSALTFDGTRLGLGVSPTQSIDANGTILARTNLIAYGALVLQRSSSSLELPVAAYTNGSGNILSGGTKGDIIAFGNAGGDGVIFANSNAEQMRLTSTGLGIGTSSPAARLDLNASGSNAQLAIQNWPMMRVVGTTLDIGGYNASQWTQTRLYTNGNIAATLDSSGNLGLGVTPSAWGGNFKALDIAGGSGGACVYSATNVPYAGITTNAFNDGVAKYKVSSQPATDYLQFNGVHSWYTAPSGTAGNAISFTQAMTLDASGNLLVGTTSNTGGARVDVVSNATSAYTARSATTGAAQTVKAVRSVDISASHFANAQYDALSHAFVLSNSSTGMTLSSDGTFRVKGAGSAGTTDAFQVAGGAPADAARIDSSGNLLVGTTTQIGSEKFGVVSGSSAAGKFKGGSDANVTVDMWNPATSGDNIFAAFRTETAETTRGSISYNRAGGLVAYNVTSDYRAKDIIGPVTDSGALIDSTPVYMGKMKGATQERPMFIAHEVPAYAHTGEKDAVDADGNPVYQQMDASALVPVMWAELQSLRARVAQLESN